VGVRSFEDLTAHRVFLGGLDQRACHHWAGALWPAMRVVDDPTVRPRWSDCPPRPRRRCDNRVTYWFDNAAAGRPVSAAL